MAENKVATMMEDLPASLNFSEEEVKVLEYWVGPPHNFISAQVKSLASCANTISGL